MGTTVVPGPRGTGGGRREGGWWRYVFENGHEVRAAHEAGRLVAVDDLTGGVALGRRRRRRRRIGYTAGRPVVRVEHAAHHALEALQAGGHGPGRLLGGSRGVGAGVGPALLEALAARLGPVALELGGATRAAAQEHPRSLVGRRGRHRVDDDLVVASVGRRRIVTARLVLGHVARWRRRRRRRAMVRGPPRDLAGVGKERASASHTHLSIAKQVPVLLYVHGSAP